MTPSISNSPKTTAAGITALVTGIMGLAYSIRQAFHGQWPTPDAVSVSVVAIVTGWGLIKAQDQK